MTLKIKDNKIILTRKLKLQYPVFSRIRIQRAPKTLGQTMSFKIIIFTKILIITNITLIFHINIIYYQVP